MNMSSKSTYNDKKAFQIGTLKSITESRMIYFLAFIVPIIIMVSVLAMKKVYPFGSETYLRMDMYHQYCPFFSELWSKIRNGESIFYSWDIGMGSNFMAIYGYYLSSPVNWLTALFPQNAMIELMNIIIILKIAASSLTCTYYLCKHNNKRSLTAVIFGLLYASSAYLCAYSWNIMWLDCIMLFPLIILGLERLVKQHKGLLFSLTLGAAIFSNYYIAIMICISVVIYFIALLVIDKKEAGVKEIFKTIGFFALYSLLAGGVAAVILFPEICALKYTASAHSTFPKTWTRYFSFMTMMKQHLINTPVSTGLDHMPNIYCGVIVLFLYPLVLLNKKISLREKITKSIILFIFLLGFNLNILNYIWHGFHFPNSLPCRQSFIYIFILLTMCCKTLMNMDGIKTKHLGISLVGVGGLLFLIDNGMAEETVVFKSLYASLIFIALYSLIIFMMQRRKLLGDIAIILIFIITVAECTINLDKTGYSTTSRDYYLNDYSSVSALLEKVENNDDNGEFYRISKWRGYRTKNDSAWHNYNGGSVFSSTAYAALTDFYDGMGLEHSTNAYAVNGATPLVYSIFNFKYLLSNKVMPDNEIYTPHYNCRGEELYINNYVLPLGFMVPLDFEKNWDVKGDNNPFEVQNDFAYKAAGVSNLFERITFDDYDSSAIINVEEDEYLYMYIMNKTIDTIKVNVDGNEQTFTGVNHGRMIDLGPVKKGQSIEVYNPDSESKSLQMYAYTMNLDKFKEFYYALSDEGLQVESYKSSRLKGHIDVKKDGLLFTSIPYDKSFKLYVDGKLTPYTYTGNSAFIAVELSKGEHDIEFKYTPLGFPTGLFFTLLCTLCFIGCIVFRVKFKKEITEPGSLKILKSNRKEDTDK